MSFNPENSAIKVDRNLEEKLKGASFEEIKAHLANAAVEQRLVVPDVYDNSVLIPTALASAAPQKVGKAVVINGVKHSLVADDEAGLLAAENQLFRETFGNANEQTERPSDERGRFTTDPTKIIDDESGIHSIESDLVARALEAQGVDMDTLREVSNKKFEESWADSTTEFLNSEAGNWWPGGTANLRKIADVLQQMGAVDSPSVENLRRAAEYLRENDLLAENPDVTAHNKINSANSVEEIRAALGRSSSIFGR